MSTITEITTKVLSLPIKSRAMLADVLLESLSEEEVNNHEILWLKEAKIRNDNISSGNTKCNTHETVLQNARNILSCK